MSAANVPKEMIQGLPIGLQGAQVAGILQATPSSHGDGCPLCAPPSPPRCVPPKSSSLLVS